ncbi:MAG: PAS domain S-box protein [Methanosarcina sp.]
MQAQAEELKTAYEALSESEKRYRLLFAHSMDAIIVVDPRENGKILSANPAACQMLGWSEEELKGKGRDILLDLEDPALSSLLEERLRSGSARVELVYKRKNGTRFIGEISTALFEDIGGELRAVVIIRDVTERKKTEEALSRERSLLGSVMQTTDFMLVFFDPQFNFVWVNPAYAESCQMKPEELIGKNHFELYPDAENEAIFRKVRDTGESVFYKDKPFIYSDQPERGITYWDWNLAPVKDSRGNVTGLVLSLRETTKYKLAEGALRESEDRYRMLFTNMNEGFGLLECIYDEKGIPYNYRYLEINPAFKLYLGVKRGEILGKNMLELFPNSSPIALKNYKEVAISGKPANFEIFSDVAKKYLEIYVFSPAKGKIALILRDISERKRLEEQIRQRAEEVETVMKVAPAAIWIGHDPQCHNITGNQMANEFYEAEDGENVSANITPVRRFFFEGHELAADELPMQESVLKDTDIKNVEFDVLLPSGKWRTLLGSASPLHDAEGMVRGSVGTFMDITGRKQAEKALNLAYEQIQIQSEELQVQNEELQDQSEKLKEINEALRESEERYRTLFSTMDQGFCVIEMLFDENQKPTDYLFAETNPAFERHTGLENVVGKRIRELAPENEEYWYEIYGKVTLTGESVRFENQTRALNRWYEVYAYRIDQPESRKVAILFNDITKRKQMEEALKKTHENLEEKVKERTKQLAKAYKSLKESERGLAEAQKMAHIGNWNWNLLTGEIHWSDEKYRIFELKPQELKIAYDLFLSFVHPEDKDYLDKLNKRASKGEPYSTDFRIISADGIEHVVHEQCEVIFDEKNIPVRIQGTTQDITERKKTEKALAELETARLKEIHHRIKNNLQVISSLLDLQAENLDNKADLTHAEILEAFRESQDRVASIALIHEELYAGKGTDSLNFSLYLQKLAKSLFQTYRVGNTYIGLKLDLPENIFFDMDNAIPLGIIVNELVSNSLKHAFPGRDKGEIQIKITSEKEFSDKPVKAGIEENNNDENNSENNSAKDEKAEKPGINNIGTNESARVDYTLMVSDDGTGIPENLDLENSETLGLQLVSILTDQLDGKLELKRGPGTQFTISFTLSENQ